MPQVYKIFFFYSVSCWSPGGKYFEFFTTIAYDCDGVEAVVTYCTELYGRVAWRGVAWRGVAWRGVRRAVNQTGNL